MSTLLRITALLVCAHFLPAQTTGLAISDFPLTYTVASNYPADLLGPVDTRMAGQSNCGSPNSGPCIWGTADSASLPMSFAPPPGYRTQILSLRGDLTVWIKSLPGDPPTPLESAAGVLLGFQSSSATKAPQCTLCANGTPLYIQGFVTEKQPGNRFSFDYENLNFTLDSDNLLITKLADFLNTTGKPIHEEATWTVSFRFVPADKPVL